jgi:NAD(P)-dependent dehydrogenase (short-subunit alcohol dehydrogenase family)
MTKSEFDLSGRTAIVTGGGRGIGKGICLALAQVGANIVVSGRKSAAIETTARELDALGSKSLAIQADVCSQEQVDAMVRQAVDTFGGIDILVNNAGGITPELMIHPLDMNEYTWDHVVDLNLKSVFFCSQAAARVMIGQKKGNIINISSITGLQPYPSCVAYGAAKAGVINMTQSLAHMLGPYNIRVNSVAPGVILSDAGQELMAKYPELAEQRRKAIPLRRLGTPADVGWTVAFLASDASAYITGQLVTVDGAIPKSPDLSPAPVRVK